MTNEERQKIADLCRAYDEFMIEAREGLRRPPVNESNDAGLIYKDYDNGALQHAQQPEPQPDWSGWEKWLRGHLDNLREEMACGIAQATMTLIHCERIKFERKLGILEGKLRELHGMLGAALAIIGADKAKGESPSRDDGSIVELPKNFLRRTHDAA